VIKLLIADDQALVRGGFRMILDAQADMEVRAEAGDGAEVLAACDRYRPDVVLMDIRMPNVDGIEATRHLLARPGSRPRVLMLTTFDLDEYAYEAMRAGASGFMLKDVDPSEVVRAVRIVHAGDALLAPGITRRLIEEFTRRPRAHASMPPAFDSLTAREIDVLRLVARGLSNAEIGSELYVSPATAKTHVARILFKLDLRDRVQAVVLAYETGLVQPGAD
jgi:DNA-binding NarL/FixJ family response regulator